MTVWRRYFAKNQKDKLVFVSDWLKKTFCKNLRVGDPVLGERSFVISNCVGEAFEKNRYDWGGAKEYDFITIRGNMDDSKYGVDIVCDIATSNPDHVFLLIGKGSFFNYFERPANLIWLEGPISHGEMIEYLQKSKCALMPTRVDTQGLATCEMATFGIPVVTSNIDVCKEVLKNFNNVLLIDNSKAASYDASVFLDKAKTFENFAQTEDYLAKNTIDKELELFQTMIS